MESSLVEFWKQLLAKENGSQEDFRTGKPVFQILGIYMYLADTDVDKLFPDYTNTCSFVYDVLLSDGKESLKCVLAPEFHNAVQFLELRLGDIVEIQEAKAVNAKSIKVVLLKSLKILSSGKGISKPDVPFMHGCSTRQNRELPLISNRITYLNIWSTNTPYGQNWTQPADSLILNGPLCDYSEEKYNFKDTVRGLAETFTFLPKPYPWLLVRILFKGKLHHYGKTFRNHECPFQGYLLVGDHTGMCTVVIWDRANFGTFQELKPGDLIALKGYLTAKCPLTQDRLTYLESLEDLPLKYPLQLKVNLSRQISRCYPEEVESFHGSEITLPEVKYNFVGHDILRNASADSYVDVVGLVLHAGVLMREKSLDGYGFWMYQWLKLVDHTCCTPVWVKYYLSDMKPVYPDTVVALTRMKVITTKASTTESPPGSNKTKPEFLYLIGIAETQVLRIMETSDLPGVNSESETVRKCLEWSKSARSELMSSITVGGVDLTPFHYPAEFELFFEGLPKHEQDEARKMGIEAWLMSLKIKWKDVWEKELVVRERRPVLFYGQLYRVEWVSVTENESADSRSKEPRMKKCWQSTLNDRRSADHYQQIQNSIQWVLPHFYSCSQKEDLDNIIRLPGFSAEQLLDENYRRYAEHWELPDCKRSCLGFYSLVLNNEVQGSPLLVHYFPEPACEPKADSLSEMLSHNQKQNHDVNWQTFNAFNPSLWQQNIGGAYGMWKKEYLFLLDLIFLDINCIVAVVNQIYDAPSAFSSDDKSS